MPIACRPILATPDIFDLFVPYETRSRILGCLSAYDVAKLDLSLGGLLHNQRDRRRYLNPVRDLLWDLVTMKGLIRDGMKLVVFGKDVCTWKDRVNDERYLTRNRNARKKVRLFLVGTFPIMGKSEETLRKMIGFTINGISDELRMFGDRYQLKRIAEDLAVADDRDKPFLMAFGAPLDPYSETRSGSWFKVTDVPESTVDLRIYVPTFTDRLWEEVRLPVHQIPRCFGLQLVRSIFAGKTHVRKAYLLETGVQLIENSVDRRILIRLNIFLIGSLL
ncbi:hypothetical protein T440DRAFT_527187 [Plenodomus tracheiphilus IPT5]|uniref:Uncharacterized protein n=1 Tax=Plenodomus tracheiphilus IPT5 TaxID=1408161 RepID=A0A6A7ALY3_9PLEO|nr:hypothetical protein T440DRAFT_527187 [Plenodomus tracheiphilus IPT5]